ncbi:hypothetical protein KIN20_019644 [Parelaphostrongylus tenuis]|uniref:Mos1 transposase HTH domain-containing protein n=1 Tax=Parelaphostrongylus tenuis TaxID=148309 RepID=A0AAD5MRU9_PARTN|nr:hypothetical protein KIN20_019644 [Parelaphostrongylus tenuis]
MPLHTGAHPEKYKTDERHCATNETASPKHVKRQLSTTDTEKEICVADGEGAVSHATAAGWYKQFESGDLSLKGQSCFDWPLKLDDGDLQAALDAELSSSTRELTVNLAWIKSQCEIVFNSLTLPHKSAN